MNTFKPGDWVCIDQHPDETINGLTGTVAHETGEPGLYMVHLDKPLDDGTRLIEAFENEMVLIQSCDVLAVVTAADGAGVAAVHNRPGYRIDVVCSAHGPVCTFILAHDTTVAETSRIRTVDATSAVHRHATTAHTNHTDALDRSRPS